MYPCHRSWKYQLTKLMMVNDDVIVETVENKPPIQEIIVKECIHILWNSSDLNKGHFVQLPPSRVSLHRERRSLKRDV